MNTLIPINNVNVSFEVVGDEIFANSLQIAEVFGKDHSNVLKAVNKIPNNKFKNSNFKTCSYCDKKGEQRRIIKSLVMALLCLWWALLEKGLINLIRDVYIYYFVIKLKNEWVI